MNKNQRTNKRRTPSRRTNPARFYLKTVALDIVMIAVALVIFAYYHHVRTYNDQSLGITSTRDMAVAAMAQPQAVPVAAAEPAAAESATAEPAAEAPAVAAPPTTAEPAAATQQPAETQATVADAPVGWFGDKFADKFNDGTVNASVQEGAISYQSGNLNITGTRYVQDKLVYYVTDFYIKDISCLKRGLANQKFGRGQRAWTKNTAQEYAAVLAVNGDYYGARTESVVIANGELFRKSAFHEVCVLYWDGSVRVFAANAFDAQQAMADGAYQAWDFGPSLLDANGHAYTELAQFASGDHGTNPRTVFGYYEPGHYCFVVVDGRSKASSGLYLVNLAALMENLGCTIAYNLDGGQTAEMVYQGQTVNKPSDGGRKCSDIVMLVEP